MRSGSTTSYAVALTAAACLVLSGCTDGDAEEPTASPSASGSATSSGSASPSPSASGSASASPSSTASVTVPAAARAHTEAGAIEFAKFYILESDRAFVTVDSSVIAPLSGPSCEGCDVNLQGVAQLKKNGERQVKPSITVTATNVLPGGDADGMEVQVLTADQSVNVVNAKGTPTSATEAGKTTYRVYVTWNGRWLASDLGIEE